MSRPDVKIPDWFRHINKVFGKVYDPNKGIERDVGDILF